MACACTANFSGLRLRPCAAVLAIACLLVATDTFALGIDHRIATSDSGIWARRVTDELEFGTVAVELGGALWLGGQSELGHTYWESIDGTAFSAVAAQAMKWTFGRERPSQTPDPNEWFRGARYQSFPSGEVTLQASFVTPLILEYAGRNPWVWALEALPAYDAAARVKQGAHWQTDVLAAWGLGTGFGFVAHAGKSPWFLSISPHRLQLGLRKSF